MGRNLYILGGTLGGLALLSVALSFSHFGEVPGTPSDASLWRTTGVALLAIALIVSLAGVLSSLSSNRPSAAPKSNAANVAVDARGPPVRSSYL